MQIVCHSYQSQSLSKKKKRSVKKAKQVTLETFRYSKISQ